MINHNQTRILAIAENQIRLLEEKAKLAVLSDKDARVLDILYKLYNDVESKKGKEKSSAEKKLDSLDGAELNKLLESVDEPK